MGRAGLRGIVSDRRWLVEPAVPAMVPLANCVDWQEFPSVKILHDEAGLSTLEYIIILVLVAVIGIVSWQLFGDSVAGSVDEAHAEITSLGVAGGGGGSRVGNAGGSEGVEAVGGSDSEGATTVGAEAEDDSSEQEAGASGGEGETRVVGVVREEGDIAVYTAPGTEESSGGYGMLITLVLVVLLAFGGVFVFFKAKGGSQS